MKKLHVRQYTLLKYILVVEIVKYVTYVTIFEHQLQTAQDCISGAAEHASSGESRDDIPFRGAAAAADVPDPLPQPE